MKVFREIVYVEKYASSVGLLQGIDPRFKLICISALIFTAVTMRTLVSLLILAVIIIALCATAKVSLKFFLLRTTIFIPIFAGLIALPVLFTTAGNPLFSFGYEEVILTITKEGVYKAALFVSRVWICVALSVLLVLTTRFSRLIQAMQNLRFPKVLVTMIAITYRFIFLFLDEAFRMSLARESRAAIRPRWKESLKTLATMIATLFLRAHERGERVYLAMRARGYGSETESPVSMRPRARDWAFMTSSILLCMTMISMEHLLVGGS